MPTIRRENGFRLWFYSDERGEPPHVHIEKADGKANFWLEPVTLAGSRGFNARDIAAILRIVRANRPEFLRRWNGYFRKNPSDST